MALDPKTNRTEREREAARKKPEHPLEPPFPFSRVLFDPFFFSLEVTPLKPGEKKGDRSAL